MAFRSDQQSKSVTLARSAIKPVLAAKLDGNATIFGEIQTKRTAAQKSNILVASRAAIQMSKPMLPERSSIVHHSNSGALVSAHIRSAHLGLDAHPPSPCPHDRAGRRHRARRLTVGVVPVPVLSAMACARKIIPPTDAGKAFRCARSRSIAVLRPASSSRRTRRLTAFLTPLRKIRWYVYGKRPFAGPEAVLAYLSR